MKHKQILYAIIRKSAYEYRNDLRCSLTGGRLDIFWLRKVAQYNLIKMGMEEQYEVIKVALWEY